MFSFEYPRKLRKPKFFQSFHGNQKGSLAKNDLMFSNYFKYLYVATHKLQLVFYI